MSESKFKIKECEKKDNKRGNQVKSNKIVKENITKVEVNKDENSSMNTLSGHFLSHQQEIILKEKIKKDLPEYIPQIKKKSSIAYKTCEKCRLLVINGYNSSNYSNHKQFECMGVTATFKKKKKKKFPTTLLNTNEKVFGNLKP